VPPGKCCAPGLATREGQERREQVLVTQHGLTREQARWTVDREAERAAAQASK
jgi:hypothetical protein